MRLASSKEMIHHVRHSWGKFMLISAAPVVLTLALHLIHLLVLPLLSHVVQIQSFHHSMHGGASNDTTIGTNWFYGANLLINLFGIGYAGCLLWLTRKAQSDTAVYVCRGFSFIMLLASTWMLVIAI